MIGAQQLVVITRDQRIRYRAAEKLMWVRHGVWGFVLTGRKSQSTADSLSVLERHWPGSKRPSRAEPQVRGCTPSPTPGSARFSWESPRCDRFQLPSNYPTRW